MPDRIRFAQTAQRLPGNSKNYRVGLPLANRPGSISIALNHIVEHCIPLEEGPSELLYNSNAKHRFPFEISFNFAATPRDSGTERICSGVGGVKVAV